MIDSLREFRYPQIFVVACNACGKRRKWRSWGTKPSFCNACLSNDVTVTP